MAESIGLLISTLITNVFEDLFEGKLIMKDAVPLRQLFEFNFSVIICFKIVRLILKEHM